MEVITSSAPSFSPSSSSTDPIDENLKQIKISSCDDENENEADDRSNTSETVAESEDLSEDSHENVYVHEDSGYSGLYTGESMEVLEEDKDTNQLMPHGQGDITYQSHPTVHSYSGTWKEGKQVGQGVTTLKNGDVYSGEHDQMKQQNVIDGFHGFGTYTWKDDRKYIGMFEYGKPNGQGRYSWPNGAVYEGTFASGIREGHGKYSNDSESYTGDWKADKYDGHGVLKCKFTENIETLYRGYFENGKPHGRGIEYNPDGTIRHDGMWEYGQPLRKESCKIEDSKAKSNDNITVVDNTVRSSTTENEDDPSDCLVVENELLKDAKGFEGNYRGIIHKLTRLPHGNGTMVALTKYDADKHSIKKYEGLFKMGHHHGKGRICWVNGDSYEGDFVMGKRQGYGVYQWKDGKKYSGDYFDDLRHGKGTFESDSNVYEGEFCRGKRHGQGRFIFKDGSEYDGEWKDGEYSGKGVLMFHDGSKYEGEWKGGLYNGRGVLISGGRTYDGEFRNGLAHGHGKEIDSSNGQVLFEGQWIDGQSEEEIEKAAAAAAAKKRSDLLQQQHDQQPSLANTSPVVTTLSSLSLSLSLSSDKPNTLSSASSFIAVSPRESAPKSDDDCEAVVNKVVSDSLGRVGQYTGIVLKSTEKPHGVGRIVYSDGRSIHEGFWDNGTKHGRGRCLFVREGEFHEGEYVNGLREGPGQYRWKDGRLFVGVYKNDLRHGEGTFTYPNGDKYCGMFERGDRNGFGRIDFENGFYEGEWKDGRYHGSGKLESNGQVCCGSFENGIFVEGRNYTANQPSCDGHLYHHQHHLPSVTM